MHQHETVIVVAGGDDPADGRAVLPRDAFVIAADGGLELAHALGLDVALAVGDFDSAPPAAVAAAEAAGTRVERHPAAKDATDLELALDAALALEPHRILVVGSGGGRLDHVLAALMVLASPRYAAVAVDALLGEATVHVIRDERLLAGRPGELVTLVAAGGAAAGVVTEGLVYPLRGETLDPTSSRGVSNVFAAPEARVALERGVLLAIRPGDARGDARVQ